MENIIMIAATVAIAIPVAALLDAAIQRAVESANHLVTSDAHKATGKGSHTIEVITAAPPKLFQRLRLTNFVVCDQCEGKGDYVSRNHGTTLCKSCLGELLRTDVIEFNRSEYVPQQVYYADLYADQGDDQTDVQDEPVNVLICTCGCEYIDSKGRCGRCNAVVDMDTYVDATTIECNGCGHLIPLTELKGDGECSTCNANEADWAELDEEVDQLGGLGGQADLITCMYCKHDSYSAEEICCWPIDLTAAVAEMAQDVAQDVEDGWTVEAFEDERLRKPGKVAKKATMIRIPTKFGDEVIEVTTLAWDFEPRARQPKTNKKADRRQAKAMKQAREAQRWGMLQAELANEAFYAELPELTSDLF